MAKETLSDKKCLILSEVFSYLDGIKSEQLRTWKCFCKTVTLIISRQIDKRPPKMAGSCDGSRALGRRAHRLESSHPLAVFYPMFFQAQVKRQPTLSRR